MHKFPITNYRQYKDLPLDQLNELKFSVYILGYDGTCIFVNTHAVKELRKIKKELIGKNIWQEFEGISSNSSLLLIRKNMEKKVVTNIKLISPISLQQVYVTGYPLEDCYYFTSSTIPDKEDLLHELRSQLRKGTKGNKS